MRWPIISWALCACVALWGCDDSAGPDGAGGAGGAAERDRGGAGGGQAGPEFGPRQDASVVDMGRAGLGFGEPCEDNRECQTGWCVPFEDRNVCTRPCLQDGCPDNWGCLAVANTVPDVVFICFPPGNRLCGACREDGDCPNGRCHTVDGQQVCGLDCGEDSCPPDYSCGPDGQCVPDTGSCSCNARFAGRERLCEQINAFGTCLGRETCDPQRGWVGCDAQQPQAEICNGIDDDCNGLADDILGLGEACSREVEHAGETLSCAGRLVCSAEAGPAPICTAPEPGPERCNFLDDDCDGETDEGFEQVGTVCQVGIGVCQRVGVFSCSPDGAEARCDVVAGEPGPERCNGLDDDCDGAIDEDFPELNGACEAGVGSCRRAGAVRCAPDGAGSLCTAVAGAPGIEICDGLDNDCDGTADEDWPELFAPCEDGIGACRRQGFLLCTEDGAGLACTARGVAPGIETCNGVDDDCDGQIDEGFPGVNQPCGVGVGRCQRPGVTVCSPDGAEVVCGAAPGAPEAEACNGLDDDCDGAIDEDFPTLDALCQAGVGACARVGILRCAPDGEGVACNAEPAPPGLEICNGADDDCDGAVDEGFPDKDRPCTAGVGLCARSGIQRCTPDGAETRCDAQPGEPAEETCDGFDNDCDGLIDEGFPGVNRPCSAGEGLCRRAGITVCDAAGEAVICNAEPALPAPETCNGLDDDCDGRIDEGFADLLTACNVGRGACLRQGVRICAVDGASTRCDAEAGAPGVERCNGIDDDCDGTVDEDYAGLGTACAVGLGECRANGVRVCSADGGAVLCDAMPGAPAAERCDGLDNDCDGRTDEGFVGLGTACAAGVGLCRAAGVQICAPAGDRVLCDAAPGAPAPERCNALDDDCDGAVDEGFAGLGEACTAGRGACLRQGVRLCTADGVGVACSARAGQAQPELCNGIDDDCDGRTDEAFPALNQACEAGIGACRQVGVQICTADGAATACDAQAGAPAAETCDGLDNDCDGRVDEAFPTLGQACEAGRGECRRGGVVICAGPNATACDAQAGPPRPEICDYRDDDCDGVVDNGFVDAQGRYVSVPHCGACGANCAALWQPSPEAFGLTPTCGVQGGVAQCGFTCRPGFRDADGRPDNGCELAIDAGAVYVAPPESGGVFAGDCGTVDRPCATIGLGLDRARALGRARVRVSEGIFRETVDLIAGVDLLGGHNRITWIQDPDLYISLIEGDTDDDPVHRYGVRARDIAVPTRLVGFVIRSETPLVEGNSYGIYVQDSTSALRIERNRVFPGDGGRGLNGGGGGNGQPGQGGQGGLASYSVLNDICGPNPGPAGGQRSCGGINVHGGRGGAGTCPVFNTRSGDGQAGLGPAPGPGGAGGWHLISLAPNECTVSESGPADARSGTHGAPGGDGRGGAGAPDDLGLGGLHWRGLPGGDGLAGAPGAGGGGGGAAASVNAAWALNLGFFVAADIGASGGSGGSGGCQGAGGVAGTAGGGSFAIYVTFVARAANGPGGIPVIADNLLARGRGGPGGDGGAGGGGGIGGAGGPGATARSGAAGTSPRAERL